MRHILLDALLLALLDLLTKRLPALQLSTFGAATVKLLMIQRDKIAALPAVLTGRPLADKLAATDARHDGIGASIWMQVESYLRHPDTKQAVLDAAKLIRATFIPTLDELGNTYEEEAKKAKDRKPSVAAMTSALKMFPVVGGTLLDWVIAFLAEGETLDTLLSARADAKDRKLAAQLRTETIGILSRLRKNMAAEMKNDPSLPADLDAQVFAYFDMLEEKAAEAAADAKREEGKAAAEAKAAADAKASTEAKAGP